MLWLQAGAHQARDLPVSQGGRAPPRSGSGRRQVGRVLTQVGGGSQWAPPTRKLGSERGCEGRRCWGPPALGEGWRPL